MIQVFLSRLEDALEYGRWLSGIITCPIRLPTEAEWEKVARAGTDGLRHPWCNDIAQSRANMLIDPLTKSQCGRRPTGTYPPHPFGLYDICGNVCGWVFDW